MAVKLTQNQYYGNENEIPNSLTPGSTYIAVDTYKVFIYNEQGEPIEISTATLTAVPYTGAVTDLDMGANAVIAQNVQVSGGTGTEGTLTWNAQEGTLDLEMLGGNVTQQVGQETLVHIKAAEALVDGDVVYASGAVGASGQIEVSKFLADGSIPAYLIMGIATEAIAIGSFGFITSFGKIRGLDTSAFTIGDVLYASPTVAGQLTSTIPISPSVAMPVAFAVNINANNGEIFSRLTPPNELAELHDVHFTEPLTAKQIIVYSTVDGHWNNETISSLFDEGANMTVLEHADNAAAITAGLVVGDVYRTVDVLKIVH